MNKKLLLILVLLLLLVSFVSAVPIGGISNYLHDEGSGTTLSDDWNSYNGTLINTPTWSSTVPIYNDGVTSPDYSLSYDGSTEYTNLGATLDDSAVIKTINFWIKKSAQILGGWGGYISNDGASSGGFIGFDGINDKDKVFIRSNDDGSSYIYTVGTAIDTDWHMITVVINGTDGITYIDGVEVDKQSFPHYWKQTTEDLTIGKSDVNYAEVKITSIQFFSDAITPTQVGYLFDCNDIEGCTTAKFDITNTNSINNMTAYFNGTSYSTTNGTINTGINVSFIDELFNITIVTYNDYFFNRTYYNYNISDDLIVNFFELNITVVNALTSTGIDNFSISLINLNTSYASDYSTTDGDIILGVTDGEVYQINLSLIGYSYDDTTASILINNNTNYTFYIYSGLYNCSLGGATALNFNIYGENSPSSLLNADVEIAGEQWFIDKSDASSFNFSFSGDSSYSLCLLPNSSSFFVDAYIKYTTDSNLTHRYYLLNRSVSNITQNISMFNFNGSDDTISDLASLKIITRDEDTYSYMSNVVGKLQRNYLGEDVWRTVQMDRSGDFGSLFYNIYEQDTDYRFIFVDEWDRILQTTNSLKFLCTGGVCELTYLLNEYNGEVTTNNLTISFDYDNTTKIINVSWYDPTGRTTGIRLKVTKETMSGTYIICDNTVSAASGSSICDVTGYSREIFVWVRSDVDGVWFGEMGEWLSESTSRLSSVLSSAESGLWTFAISLTIVGMALISPVTAIIALLGGVYLMFALGILGILSGSIIILIFIMGVIISVKIKK